MHKRLKRTWADIDLDALAHNYQILRQHMGDNTQFMGIVKADAYGHGAVRIAHKLEQLGAEYLGVSNIDEAAELRHHGIALPILILGYTPTDMTDDLIALHVTQDIPSLEAAKAYSAEAAAVGKTLKVHLKLDSGMGRLGFLCDESHFQASLQEILQVLTLPNLEFEGIFSHFAVADDLAGGQAYTDLQFQRFRTMVTAVEERSGYTFPLHHCCNSGGVVYHKEYAWDLCRPGLLLYGYAPSGSQLDLQPVMRLKTTIGPMTAQPQGASISYGRTYTTPETKRIATIPIGYADGILCSVSSKWSVATAYGLAPICGRICMDMCMVDVTHLPQVQTGDEVEVFGTVQTAEDMATVAGTIAYEIICGISKRVPRVYLEDGQEVDYQLQLLL